MKGTEFAERVELDVEKGSLVRLTSAASTTPRLKMARWIVDNVSIDGQVSVHDAQDPEDTRQFERTQLELIGGGVEKITRVEIEAGKKSQFKDEDYRFVWGEDGALHFVGDGEEEDEWLPSSLVGRTPANP